MRLRWLFISSAILGIPLSVYLAVQSVDIPSIPFSKALEQSAGQGSEEQAKKIKIAAQVIVDSDHPSTDETLYAIDSEMKTFLIKYSGSEVNLRQLKNGQSIIVFGHVHDGAQPYLHASEVRD